MNKNKTVRVLAPASVANLVCGFDVLGMSLTDPADEMVISLSDTPGLRITHTDPFGLPEEPEKKMAPFQMYFNEIIILENSVLAQLDGSKAAFIVHNVLNVLMTRDPRFCDNMSTYIQNLIKKSTLISTVSERERSRFFKHLRQRIAGRKQHLKFS